MPNNENQLVSNSSLVASDTYAPRTFSTLKTSKDLMREAIDFMEKSFSFAHSPFDPSLFPSATGYKAFALCHEEISTFSKPSYENAILGLSIYVNNIAVNQRIPTLVVTGNHSLVAFAVDLLFWRAELDLNDAIDFTFSEDDFKSLVSPVGEISHAPLFAAKTMPYPELECAVRYAVTHLGIKCLVMDYPSFLTPDQIRKLEGELPQPIRFV
jgi:hypothetical protein